MSTFIQRIAGAAKLDAQTYEEVEADSGALGQAIGVVILSSLAAGIGSLLAYGAVFQGLILGTLAALVGWVIWAFLTWFIGTRWLPEDQTEANLGQLLRTIGFASAPGMLRILIFIPLLGPIIAFIASVWMLVAMIIAVRQALDYRSTWRAIGVCIIGWVVLLVIQLLLLWLVGSPVGGEPMA